MDRVNDEMLGRACRFDVQHPAGFRYGGSFGLGVEDRYRSADGLTGPPSQAHCRDDARAKRERHPNDHGGPSNTSARPEHSSRHERLMFSIWMALAPPASNTVHVTVTFCSAYSLSTEFWLSPGIPALTGM